MSSNVCAKCDTDLCAICYEELRYSDSNNPIETLSCGHKFHYNCIFNSLKEKSLLYKSISKIKACPYCRKSINYLNLPKKTFPHKNIHIEYNEIEIYIQSNNFDILNEKTKKYMNENLCQTILRTGKMKGTQCQRKKQKNSDICHIHKRYFENKQKKMINN